MAKFTDRSLKALAVPPGRKDVLVFDDECPGLGVRISANAKGVKRTFLVQWTDLATKRKVREPIGVWGSITIDQARIAVRSRLGDVARGVDVVDERRKRKAVAEADRAERALTLEALLSRWADLHLSQRRARYAAEAQRSIRAAFSTFLKRPAVQLSRADAILAVDRLVAAGKVAMAGQTVRHARACFAWAQKRGAVPANPFQGLPVSLPSSERERVLTDGELAEIWAAAATLPYPFGPFYRLAILTLQRREEVAGMAWSEISLDRALWTIPASRMKNHRPHDVHLPEAAQAVLADLPRLARSARSAGPDYVFTTTGRTSISGYSRAKTTLDAAIATARVKAAEGTGRKPEKLVPWRLHDIRRTGVSHLAAMGFDSIIVDKLLAHKPAKLKGVASVYQRHDFAAERARALDAWADHVIGASPTGNVVALASRKRERA